MYKTAVAGGRGLSCVILLSKTSVFSANSVITEYGRLFPYRLSILLEAFCRLCFRIGCDKIQYYHFLCRTYFGSSLQGVSITRLRL